MGNTRNGRQIRVYTDSKGSLGCFFSFLFLLSSLMLGLLLYVKEKWQLANGYELWATFFTLLTLPHKKTLYLAKRTIVKAPWSIIAFHYSYPNFQVCQFAQSLMYTYSRVLWVGYWWYLWCMWCHSHKGYFRFVFGLQPNEPTILATQPPPPMQRGGVYGKGVYGPSSKAAFIDKVMEQMQIA